jgi:hypothetical protein
MQTLNNTQLERIYRKLWDRVRYGQGYQPFGFDMATLWVTRPQLAQSIADVLAEAKRRKSAQ